MKTILHLILSLFFFHVCAQNDILTKEEIKNQLLDNKLMYADSDEDVKKIEYLINYSEKINYKEGIILGKLNVLSYLKELSDYKGMLEIINELEALPIDKHSRLSKLYIYKYHANSGLGIDKAALQNLQDALKHAQLVEDRDKRHLAISTVYNSFGIYYSLKSMDSVFHYLKKELASLEQIGDENQELKFKKHLSIALNKTNIGSQLMNAKPQRLDLAEPYLMDVYNYRTTHPEIFEQLNLPILSAVGNFYLTKENYEEALKIYNEVLEIEKNKKNLTYRSYAYEALIDTYEGLQNVSEQAKYTKLYASLNDSINKAAKKEVGQQFDKLITKVEKKNSSNIKSIILASIGTFLLLGMVFWIELKRRNKILHQKYEVIISKIKSEPLIPENNKITNESEEPKISTSITDDTAKLLVLKLEKFEKSKLYLKSDITRSSLASRLNTNTKYLFDILKVHKEKNYTEYINGLRIDHIMRKLVEDPLYKEYKIEYLAEECGFNSRQVFITAFKKETGFTPSYFIENLKKDDAEISI